MQSQETILQIIAVANKSENPAKGIAIKYSSHLHSGLGMVVRCAMLKTRTQGKMACNINAKHFKSIFFSLVRIEFGISDVPKQRLCHKGFPVNAAGGFVWLKKYRRVLPAAHLHIPDCHHFSWQDTDPCQPSL